MMRLQAQLRKSVIMLPTSLSGHADLHYTLSQKQPKQVPDLLGYQSLMLLASMAYEGDGWQGYDRVFQQHAAANSLTTCATIDGSLWHVAFGGKRIHILTYSTAH